nr:tyrosinase family oxidase copper chaperone [Kibdelosporangium sp. MJ126-NF4]CEL21788.1 Tyrosinase cofactor precursor [Kibdelosporangium sp. MJ126-NF4]
MSIDRRDALKIGVMAAASMAAVGTAGVLGAQAIADGGEDSQAHAEKYKGRDISVSEVNGEPVAHIDGVPLHLMKLGDDAYMSALCHYEIVDSPLVAARRAVDELRGANLLAIAHHV